MVLSPFDSTTLITDRVIKEYDLNFNIYKRAII